MSGDDEKVKNAARAGSEPRKLDRRDILEGKEGKDYVLGLRDTVLVDVDATLARGKPHEQVVAIVTKIDLIEYLAERM